MFVVIPVSKDLMIPRKSKRSYTVFRDDFNSFNKASYTIEVSSWGGGVGFIHHLVFLSLVICRTNHHHCESEDVRPSLSLF